jgi:hypothetical protein
VREQWVQPLVDRNQGQGETMFGQVMDFMSGTGALDTSRIVHGILSSNVVEKATKNAGKYASTAIGGMLGSFPIVGSMLGSVAEIITDVTTETLSDAAKLELEAQMWTSDVTANLENILAIVDIRKCMKEMPAIQYALRTKDFGTLTNAMRFLGESDTTMTSQ